MMDPLVSLVLRSALALLFATAAFHKLRDPRSLIETVRAYQLAPALLAAPLALGLTACESATVVSLLVPASARTGAFAALALLLLYSGAIAINLARGRRDVDCGCLGPAHRQPLSEWLLVRNGILCAAAIAAAQAPGTRVLHALDAGTGIAALSAVVLLFMAAQRLATQAPILATARRSS